MTKTFVKVSSAVACAIALAALGVSGATAATRTAPSASPQSTTHSMFVTYYGWYDNSPPGCAIANGGCAGGKGTFSDPITFASDKAELPYNSEIYYPTVKKYFVMQDDCTECDEDWSGQGPDGGPHLYHVDMWTGGKGGNEFDAIDCEDALTQQTAAGKPVLTSVIVNPPSNEPVSSQPLFNAKTNQCYGGATITTTYGQYKNASSGDCIADPGNSSASGTAADAAACTGAAGQDLAFNGAFFMINNLCLKADGGATQNGTKLQYAGCGGGPGEQWEVNANGTIAGIQSNKCIAQSGTSLQLASCTAAPSQEWAFTAEAAP